MNGIFDLQNPKFFNNLSGPIPDIEEAAYELEQEGKLDLSNLQKFSKALGQAQYNLSKPRLGPFSLFDVGSLFFGGPLSRILTGTSVLRNISDNYPVGGLLGLLGDRANLTGTVGGQDLRGDTGLDTFRRSTSLADFVQRRRDQKAREEAAAQGLAKQRQAALQSIRGPIGGGDGGVSAPGSGAHGMAGRAAGGYQDL